jgi:hypothetical protein
MSGTSLKAACLPGGGCDRIDTPFVHAYASYSSLRLWFAPNTRCSVRFVAGLLIVVFP